MARNEDLWVGKQRKGKRTGDYYKISVAHNSGDHGLELENEAVLLIPPMVILCPPRDVRYGFPSMPEKPVLRPDAEYHTRPPKDFDRFHSYLIVSYSVKNVLDEVDAGSVEFVECDVLDIHGRLTHEKHYLCEVVREVDALDEINSDLMKSNEGDEYFYIMLGDQQVNFHKPLLRGAQIFRQKNMSGIFCTRFLRDKFLEGGVANGRYFRDVSIRM